MTLPKTFLNPLTAETWETFRFEFSPDGTFKMEGRVGWQEAICPICHAPIRWCLDIFSFTTGHPYQLAHAACVWTREGIEDVARKVAAL